MKKGLILLLLSLIPLLTYSQDSTYVSSQTVLGLLCNDHAKLREENHLFLQKIKSLEDLNKLYVHSDSIKSSEVELYREKSIADEHEIKRLKKSRKAIGVGAGIGGTVLLILGIFIGK